MDYEISVQDKYKAVLCTCKGILDLTSAKSMARTVRKKAFELGYGSLYDVSNVSLGVGISDAYFFPRNVAEIYEAPEQRGGRAAIVYKTDKNFWEFFETTARNAGVDIKLFNEKEEAFEWLSQ